MKIVVLIGGGRTGIDLFQSLLDGHSQIVQFPGAFFLDDFLKETINTKDKKKICQIFINKNKHFFDSRYNKRERHHKLGKTRNKFFTVSKKKFTEHFIKLMNFKNAKNKKDILISLHHAYYFARGKTILKNHLIILHLHHVFRLSCMKNLKYNIIYTVRHPFASITSLINNWFKVDKVKRGAADWFYFQLDRLFFGIKKCQTFAPTTVIKLENLHKENKKVMKKFCKKFGIKYNKCLTKSTYHNLLWWGDKVSIKYLNGINKNFKNKIDLNLFFKNDLIVLTNKLNKLMKVYRYERIIKNTSKANIFLPMKIELILLKNILLSFSFTQLIKLIYYYFKRIMLLNDRSYDKIIFKKDLI